MVDFRLDTLMELFNVPVYITSFLCSRSYSTSIANFILA